MSSITRWTELLTLCFGDEVLGQSLAADVVQADDRQLPDIAIRQATVLLDILAAARNNSDLLFFILSNPPVRSVAEVAKRFYAIESTAGCPVLNADDRAFFKSELLRREPTAVICGLLCRSLIKHDNEKTQQQAIEFWERAIERNFNISRASLHLYVADDDAIKSLPDNERKCLLSYLETLQRLHVVVTDVSDISYLMRAGFSSAHGIASTSGFFDAVVCKELPKSTALSVWRRATAIDHRNERRWADYIRSRTNIPVLALETGDVYVDDSDDRVNIASLFGEMNQAQVDEYTSVLSPAAYLVDLLQFLRYSLIDPPKSSPDGKEKPITSSLQDELFRRRPEIKYLQLSKPNTLNPLRYADLTNETTQQPTAILHKVAPMKDFPFNLAFQTTRDILGSLGISRADAIELFQNRQAMRQMISLSDDSIAFALVDEAFNRRMAAEHLGLQQEDFVAITKEAYMSQKFVVSTKILPGILSEASYATLIGLKSPGEYWGYSEDQANEKMIGQVSGVRGVDHIISELLPRGGITFHELLSVLDTEYIAKTLIISVHDSDGHYTEDYSKMRLNNSPQAEEDGVSFVESCSRLHTFLRLWHRLGWSITDTDAAIVSVEAARLSGSPASSLPSISPETIEDLAAVKQLSEKTGLPIDKLLPLWAYMRYQGPESFYHKTFMLPSLLAQYRGLDKKHFESNGVNGDNEDEDDDASDEPNDDKNSLSRSALQSTVLMHLTPLQSLLGIKPSDAQLLCDISGIDVSDSWTITNASTIYRYNLLCKLLSIPLSKFRCWLSSDFEAPLIFSGPRVTLRNSCTPDWLLNRLQKHTSQKTSLKENEVLNSKAIINGVELACGKPTTFPLVQGKCYELTYTGPTGISAVQISSSAGLSESISSNCLISADTVVAVISVLESLRQASAVLEKFSLSTVEAYTLINIGVNIAQPRWNDLSALQAFVELRDMTSRNKATEPVYHLLETLSATDKSDRSKAAEAIFIKDWIVSKIEEKIASNQSAFTWINNCLLEIHHMATIFDNIGLPMETFAEWIRLRLPRQTRPDFVAAQTMMTLMLKKNEARIMSACEGLAVKKKAALISFLLSQETIKNLKIFDANGLFEYFLIDAQMGTEQQTSRVQQAIATTQLDRLRPDSIDRKKWKVFLFPENWAEPSLRDDKSEAFKAIEAAVLQANLSKEKITDIIRQYIYGAHQVADLEIQSYLWEESDQYRGTYHFFARTRTAPYEYFYRVVRVTGVNPAAPIQSWHPWKWDGSSLPKAGSYLVSTTYKGRLFLFMPQIMLKTLPKRPKENKSLELMAKNTKEVKMGWSENLNGVWSTKRVSSASLDITGVNKTLSRAPGVDATETDAILRSRESASSEDEEHLPGISSFRFWVRAKVPKDFDKDGGSKDDKSTDILVIDVFRWVKGKDKNKFTLQTLGRFEMRGSHMIAYREEELKAELDSFREVDSIAKAADFTVSQPLLTLAPAIKHDLQNLAWVMSYNEYQGYQGSGASGLVVERITGSRVESYFAMPDRLADGSVNSKKSVAENPRRMAYSTSQPLMEICTTSNSIEDIFSVLTNVPKGDRPLEFGGRGEKLFSELASPYSLYNWELGFHLVILLVERLLSTQQFELGLEIANMVFDPWCHGAPVSTATRDEVALSKKSPEAAREACWRFAPFKSDKMRTAGSMGKLIKELEAGRNNNDDVAMWLSNPFNAHSLARGRPVIYMRRFVRKHIELLIESGDELFRQNSLESIPLALQRYVQASHLFGAAPQSLPSPTKATIKTYDELFKSMDDFSSAAVDLELAFPFFSSIPGSSDVKGIVANSPKYKSVLGMVRTSYFSVPANPEVAALRERIDLRLYQIRNSLDINGNKRRTPLFDPPVDPGQLVRSVAQGGMSSSFAGAVDGPMPNYRFLFLLQKAFEMCNELKSLGDAYLSKMQKDDAKKAIEILQETRESHVMRLKYYLALIGQSESKVPSSKAKWEDIQQAIGVPTKDEFAMSPEELLEYEKSEEATTLRKIASGIERSCSTLMALPNLSSNVQPMGIGASMKFDASNVAQGMQLIASAFQTESTQRSDEASRASRKGQLIRQLQERRLSANMAGRDIKNTDRQIESQEIKLRMCKREIEMQHKQIADASDVISFMKTIYTNESLYAWMDASMHSLLYQTYVLAMDVAKSAEKAFLFERGPTSANDYLLANSYWDSGRNGTYAAQNLYLGLKRLYLLSRSTRAGHRYSIFTANQDNGNFEATFSGERYGPFEGAGAISSWSLDLPKLRQFDYHSISDVILHVKYTSLDGGALWTKEASDAVTTFKQKFGNQTFVSPLELSPGMIERFSSDPKEVTIKIPNLISQLPFWARSNHITLK
ncbi:hypothetical protein V8C35DRAFT_329405 [Trichoderma chlorosporum]